VGVADVRVEFIPYSARDDGGLLTITGLTTVSRHRPRAAGAHLHLAITMLQNNVLSPFVYAGRLKLNPLAS